MKASDLRGEYRQANASPLIISEIDLENELPLLLYSNDWVRILLVRRDNHVINTIEVELSVSMRSNSTQVNHAETITTLITYLNYILRLHEHGFKLEAIEDDILWTAGLEIPIEPDIELFEVLLPSFVK